MAEYYWGDRLNKKNKREEDRKREQAKQAEEQAKQAEEQAKQRMFEDHIRRLFTKAQEGIDHNAIIELARRYFEGDGIEQNYVEAFYWVYKAEVLGNPDAPNLRKKIEKLASDIQKKVAQKRLTEEGR